MSWPLSLRYGHVTLVSGYSVLTLMWMSIINLNTGYWLPP